MQTDLTLKAEINLYYDLYVPDKPTKPAPLLLAVHGYGAHKRYMMREAQAIAPKGFVIASIQAPYQHFRQTESGFRVGFGWLTDYKSDESVALHHDFARRVMDRLESDRLIDPRAIYLYGFSQACALNFRFALTFPDVARGVIGVCGGIPNDLETSDRFRRLDADTLYLYNTDDEFYTLEKYESYVDRLKAFAPKLTTKVYESKHEIVEPMRTDMRQWLKEKAESP
jgi:predicted esterase